MLSFNFGKSITRSIRNLMSMVTVLVEIDELEHAQYQFEQPFEFLVQQYKQGMHNTSS